MRRIPPEVLASWPKPNYVDPESRASGIIIISSCSIILTILIFALRLYSRIFVSRSTGPDDWIICPAVISALAYSTTVLRGIEHGGYRHIWDVSLDDIIVTRQLIVISNFFALMAVGFTKLSVLALYLRLSPPVGLQRFVWVFLVITSGWICVTTVTSSLLCRPLKAYWDPRYLGEQKCFDEVAIYVAFSGIDVALDTIIYLIPLPIVVQLKMPRRQKMIVGAVFGLGTLVIVAAALRLPSIIRTSKSYDITWELYDSYLWSQVENTVGIVCASSPALKALLKKYMPGVIGHTSSGNRTTNRTTNRASRATTVPARRTYVGWNELPNNNEIGIALTTAGQVVPPSKEQVECGSFYEPGPESPRLNEHLEVGSFYEPTPGSPLSKEHMDLGSFYSDGPGSDSWESQGTT